MIITCPKCETSYDVSDEIITDNGRSMRCIRCGEVWSQSLKNEENEENEDKEIIKDAIAFSKQEDVITSDLYTNKPTLSINLDEEEETDNEVYARLSLKSEEIQNHYKKTSLSKRIWIGFKSFSGLKSFINRVLLYITTIVFLLIALVYYRYDVTHKYPFMIDFYEKIGLESVVVGRGLKFENVSRLDASLDDNNKIIVKGFVVNSTKEDIVVPMIEVKLLARNGDSVADTKFSLDVEKITPFGRKSFSVSVDKPSENVKYIVVTFIK